MEFILSILGSDIFGYIGSGLVLISMLMTSMKWLRVFNMTGSFISLVYSLVTHSWPFVLLNGGLVIIHIVRLCMMKKGEGK